MKHYTLEENHLKIRNIISIIHNIICTGLIITFHQIPLDAKSRIYITILTGWPSVFGSVIFRDH